jgi:yecA family protein
MPDFDEVQSALQKLSANSDASEAHGTLCGLLLGRQEISKWLDATLNKTPATGDLLAQESTQVLQNLYADSKQQLNDEDMSFEPLLPDEDDEFALRLIALADWCQGFLYGLAMNGEALLKALSEQGKECLNDLLEISQLGHDEESSEETEAVYAELVEHVRLSVIYINEEVNPVLPSPALQ